MFFAMDQVISGIENLKTMAKKFQYLKTDIKEAINNLETYPYTIRRHRITAEK